MLRTTWRNNTYTEKMSYGLKRLNWSSLATETLLAFGEKRERLLTWRTLSPQRHTVVGVLFFGDALLLLKLHVHVRRPSDPPWEICRRRMVENYKIWLKTVIQVKQKVNTWVLEWKQLIFFVYPCSPSPPFFVPWNIYFLCANKNNISIQNENMDI